MCPIPHPRQRIPEICKEHDWAKKIQSSNKILKKDPSLARLVRANIFDEMKNVVAKYSNSLTNVKRVEYENS